MAETLRAEEEEEERSTGPHTLIYMNGGKKMASTLNGLCFSPSRWQVHGKGRRRIWLRQWHYLGYVAQPLVLPEGDDHEAHSAQPHHGGRWAADRETVPWT